ncbi:MAG: hypothetical protein GY854_25130 [Deltaproteobacteria bacterium]|nr:hypothetical protein [Deltaproteobacteria bacterium]
MGIKHVRLKRHDPRHGIVLKQYWYKGIKFLESEGWYVVSDDVAAYLKAHARQRAGDPQSPEAFDICTEEEAQEIDEQETLETQPRRPAEKARPASPRGMAPVEGKPKKKRRRKSKPKAPEKTEPADVEDVEIAKATEE